MFNVSNLRREGLPQKLREAPLRNLDHLFCRRDWCKRWVTIIVFSRYHLQVTKNGKGIILVIDDSSTWNIIDCLMVLWSKEPLTCRGHNFHSLYRRNQLTRFKRFGFL